MSVLIDRQRIASRVENMAQALDRLYPNRELLVIGILGGAFMFMADLVRQGNFASQIDFLWLESYEGTQSTGTIKVRQQVNADLQGQNVLILDDILDTGQTLKFTRNYMLQQGAKSVRAAVLLRKDRPEVDTSLAEDVGFVIADRFVVGYGLDYNGRYRQLPDLHVLEETGEE